jgi:hypothetical protein
MSLIGSPRPELDISRRKEESPVRRAGGALLEGDSGAGGALGEDHGKRLPSSGRLRYFPLFICPARSNSWESSVFERSGTARKSRLGMRCGVQRGTPIWQRNLMGQGTGGQVP